MTTENSSSTGGLNRFHGRLQVVPYDRWLGPTLAGSEDIGSVCDNCTEQLRSYHGDEFLAILGQTNADIHTVNVRVFVGKPYFSSSNKCHLV
ncbi:hypothetical protein J6590_077439 [Homalodisca vitripennis]|nr:hypothetical protein J6590_077439 [Homalodisca vitripennis]